MAVENRGSWLHLWAFVCGLDRWTVPWTLGRRRCGGLLRTEELSCPVDGVSEVGVACGSARDHPDGVQNRGVIAIELARDLGE